jgi:hypothetical protein
MIFDKHRFEIWTQAQHPYKHTLSDFAYSNSALPGITDVTSALNYIVAVLYPNNKPAVANVASLPAVGNALNDYRVVQNDGDGNPAGYRWEQREGEVSPSWHKVFDYDWSADAILAAFTDITQDLYVYQKGKSDLDATGAVITGTYAGQRIFGGNAASQNLTLSANSGDGVGPHTGFVQVDDNFRPVLNNTYDVGTNALKFKTGYFGTSALISTITLSTGSIVDSSGTIDFGATDLTTTGALTVGSFSTTTLDIGSPGTYLQLASGSITSQTGAITFGSANLTTTGTLSAAAGSSLADFTFNNGSLVSASAAINFGTNNVITTGTGSFGNVSATRLDSDNIRLDGNTISVLDLNGNLVVQANGTGIVDIQSAMTTLGQTVTGTVSITGQLNIDNLRLDANVISSQNLNGNITLTPNGTGVVEVSSLVRPASDNTLDLGATSLRFKDLYLAGNLSNGTTSISQATIQSLRDINAGVLAGMTIEYDGTQWLAVVPGSVTDHTTLTNLTSGDAGHTQFVMLAGRAGGQTVQGGTAASELLVLESTANATKGTVQTKDNFLPFTNASFSGSWSGIDIGSGSRFFRDIYTRGEMRNMRFENFTFATLPANSVQNVGRVAWATDTEKAYIDSGTIWVAVGGVNKFLSDTTWDGILTTQTFTVSASIDDARAAIWALHDNSNDFERIYCNIKAISATQVTVTVSPALPAGSYRLIGLE